MSFRKANGILCQKKIQQVLKKRGLWPTSGLNLECAKPQCFNCEAHASCKLCVKGTRCDLCKASKVHIGTIECTNNWKCNGCVQCEVQCTCIAKKHCVKCLKPKRKCEDCEDLPPKCESDHKFY